MKPPPRTRTKPNRSLKHESVPRRSRKPAFKWQRVEQRKLLNALRRLGRTGGTLDMDYASLRKYVFTRSISEVTVPVVTFALRQKRCEEEKVRKPIEVWTHIASTVAGAHEEAICTAFSQMLIVSSTEPCTLRNCDPPQDHRPPTDRPVGRTVPLRPMPCSPVQGDRPGINIVHPFQVFKTPAPTFGPVVRQPNSAILPPQQKHSTTAGTSPAVSSTPQSAATSCQPGAAKIPVAPSTSQQPASQTATPVSGQATSSSSSAAAVKTASVGSSVIQTTQQPLEQHPTTISTTSISNSTSYSPHLPFYNSSTTPYTNIVLCPAESAIVLDLLMSLPEELPKLDCNKLHKHLIQVQLTANYLVPHWLQQTVLKHAQRGYDTIDK
uniref:Uncharacterized protein n=1 Tax=Dicentrarchus labrax TaxID=13489 RepID=A0A8C4EH45_DICLA